MEDAVDGTIAFAFAAILFLAFVLAVFAFPVGLVLWVFGRLLGRRVAAALGVALIVYLGDYVIASHLACSAPLACDSPGMLLFGPTLYIAIPAMMIVTAIIMRKVWVDLEPKAS